MPAETESFRVRLPLVEHYRSRYPSGLVTYSRIITMCTENEMTVSSLLSSSLIVASVLFLPNQTETERSPDRLIKKMEAAYKRLRSMRATVTTIDNLNGEKKTARGTVELQKPNLACI